MLIILLEFGVFLPGTWDSLHTGPSHTYSQKRGDKLCRPDMIGLPFAWSQGQCSSYLAPMKVRAMLLNPKP